MKQVRVSELLDEQTIAEFDQHGVICLRQLFDTCWLERLAIGVDKNFQNPGPYNTVYTEPGKPGGFYDDYCNWQRIEEYRDFVENSPAAEIAGQLMRSHTARLYHEHVLVKEPGTEEVTPWHHDLPYYGVDGNQLCSIWLPLDDVPQSACPEFVAGSHSAGSLYYPRLFINNENYAEGIAGFESLPDIDAQRDQHTILSWELKRGDCLVFHMRTLHGAPATEGLTTRRRGFSTRWLGDDARYARRAWKTSPPYPEVNLQPGDAMEHASFPLLWRS
ncbi:MAG: phytanoyl-CoA dioxygenase family protein [Gammaproteobacteria bacterium]|nr:phytanoyl-CoA dioxygenase family protein [Gammaproteobacteria bacterium]